jgi:hypothetical protein
MKNGLVLQRKQFQAKLDETVANGYEVIILLSKPLDEGVVCPYKTLYLENKLTAGPCFDTTPHFIVAKHLGREGDASNIDLKFAKNNGIASVYTPEHFFLGEKMSPLCISNMEEPKFYYCSSTLEQPAPPVQEDGTRHLVILIFPPLYSNLINFVQSAYKAYEEITQIKQLKSGQNFILFNRKHTLTTNDRERWSKVAQEKHGYKVDIVFFDFTKYQTMHINMYNMITKKEGLKNNIIENYFRKLQMPEGGTEFTYTKLMENYETDETFNSYLV